MYAYRPLSVRALEKLLEREAYGQTARFERFAAKMLYYIAAGRHIDMERTPQFDAQLEEIFRNPFLKTKPEPQTAEEIKAHVLRLLEE